MAPALDRPVSPGLLRDIARIVGGEGGVSGAVGDRMAYARDCWPRDLIRVRSGERLPSPDAVVWPERAQDVARLLAWAQAEGVPVIPHGAGSGVVGGVRPSHGGIAVDVKRMKKVRALDADNLRLTVEAGAVGERLERWLSARGFSLGHFPSSIVCSTVGGWLAARSAGQMSTRYGKIEDMLLGMEGVTPGMVHWHQSGPRPGPGPDMNPVLVGSEGTLGVLTAGEFRMLRQPDHRSFRAFRFRSVEAGVSALRTILTSHVRPAVVRLYDALDTLVGRGHSAAPESDDLGVRSLDAFGARFQRFAGEVLKRSRAGALTDRVWSTVQQGLQQAAVKAVFGAPLWTTRALDALPGECLLVLGFEGTGGSVQAEAEFCEACCARAGATALGPGPGLHWYENRYNVSFKQSKAYAAGLFVDTMEVAATWDRLLPMFRAVRAAIVQDALVMAHFSHAYPEGCSIYFTFAGPNTRPEAPEEALAAYDRIWARGLAAAQRAGGTLSHHHGVGEAKAFAMAREHGPGGAEVLSVLKGVMDPRAVLNPGKLGLDGASPADGAASPSLEGGGVPDDPSAPASEAELARILRAAQTAGTSVTTEQSLGRAPIGAQRLSLRRMDGVQRVSADALLLEVEAGRQVGALEDLIHDQGLTLGPLHPRAYLRSVGEALSKNLLVRRGPALGDLGDLCMSVRGLLPDGRTLETRPVPRAAAGPEIDRLLVGAGGRFGIITRAYLRVARLPAFELARAYHFASLADAVQFAKRAAQAHLPMSAARVFARAPRWVCAFRLVAPSEGLMAHALAATEQLAARSSGTEQAEAGDSVGGVFDAVVEAEVPWTGVMGLLDAWRGAREVWVDFVTAQGASVVARIGDLSRAALVARANAVQARIVAGAPVAATMASAGRRAASDDAEGPTADGGAYDHVWDEVARRLDPGGVLRGRS